MEKEEQGALIEHMKAVFFKAGAVNEISNRVCFVGECGPTRRGQTGRKLSREATGNKN